ncbi:MAG: helix-turn-helix domain-containing protein [Nitrospirae bacterium]|nr:helix-turn-helix domain-containing protein [Nitrospirota bacterium]
MTQEQVAARMGVLQPTLARIEDAGKGTPELMSHHPSSHLEYLSANELPLVYGIRMGSG